MCADLITHYTLIRVNDLSALTQHDMSGSPPPGLCEGFLVADEHQPLLGDHKEWSPTLHYVKVSDDDGGRSSCYLLSFSLFSLSLLYPLPPQVS